MRTTLVQGAINSSFHTVSVIFCHSLQRPFYPKIAECDWCLSTVPWLSLLLLVGVVHSLLIKHFPHKGDSH